MSESLPQDQVAQDGGAAFPAMSNLPADRGMTLRDYFAAQAMNGSLAHDDEVYNKDIHAKWCYEIADAMLRARK